MIDRNPLCHPVKSESSNEQDRLFPIFCPQCRNRIEIVKGLCGNRLIDAILLQAERIGAELNCRQCKHTFVYHQVKTLATPVSLASLKSRVG